MTPSFCTSQDTASTNLNQEKLSRSFQGIWIPADIWLREDLLPLEKILLAEIQSLENPEKGGCFASNEYLSKFLGIKERRLQEMLSNLKEKKLIEVASFDGRQRVLRTIKYSAGQRCEIPQGRGALKCTPPMQHNAPPSYIDNIEDKKVYKTPPNPQKGEAAKAACLFGSFVRLKGGEYEDLSAKFGKKAIDEIIEEMNDYCAASNTKGYKDYAAAIRQWIRRRKTPQSSSFQKPSVDRRTKNLDGSPVDSPADGRF
jgi:hypothetical protein